LVVRRDRADPPSVLIKDDAASPHRPAPVEQVGPGASTIAPCSPRARSEIVRRSGQGRMTWLAVLRAPLLPAASRASTAKR
jgi:hypothetical protein